MLKKLFIHEFNFDLGLDNNLDMFISHTLTLLSLKMNESDIQQNPNDSDFCFIVFQGNKYKSIYQLLQDKVRNNNAAQFFFIFFKEKFDTELDMHYNIGKVGYNYVSHINIGVDASITTYFRHDNMIVYQDESQTYLSDFTLFSNNMTYLVLAKDTEKYTSTIMPYDRACIYEKSEAGLKRKIKYESSELRKVAKSNFEKLVHTKQVRKDYESSDLRKLGKRKFEEMVHAKQARKDYERSEHGETVRKDYEKSEEGERVRKDYESSELRKVAKRKF